MGTFRDGATDGASAEEAHVADPPRSPDSEDDADDAGVGPDRGPAGITPTYPGTPSWVKVSGIIALVLVLLVVAVMVAGGGEHGPGRHMPSGGPVATQRP